MIKTNRSSFYLAFLNKTTLATIDWIRRAEISELCGEKPCKCVHTCDCVYCVYFETN
jgi:hypothetical protein